MNLLVCNHNVCNYYPFSNNNKLNTLVDLYGRLNVALVQCNARALLCRARNLVFGQLDLYVSVVIRIITYTNNLHQ